MFGVCAKKTYHAVTEAESNARDRRGGPVQAHQPVVPIQAKLMVEIKLIIEVELTIEVKLTNVMFKVPSWLCQEVHSKVNGRG